MNIGSACELSRINKCQVNTVAHKNQSFLWAMAGSDFASIGVMSVSLEVSLSSPYSFHATSLVRPNIKSSCLVPIIVHTRKPPHPHGRCIALGVSTECSFP